MTVDLEAARIIADCAAKPEQECIRALADEVERLRQHVDELTDKVDPEANCACSYDAPGAVCGVHSPILKAAEARAARLEGALRALTEACEQEFLGSETDDFPDDEEVCFPKSAITFGHIRRARAALVEDAR